MRITIRWLPALIWMSVIFYLSHQPASNLESMLPFFHKIFPAMQSFNWGHFVSYFILGLTLYWGVGEKFTNVQGKLLVILMCILYGITDEFHQSFIIGRYPDYMDLRNDGIGAALAMLFISIPPINKWVKKLFNSRKY